MSPTDILGRTINLFRQPTMPESEEHLTTNWEGQLSLDQVYNWHQVHSPGIPTFVFNNERNEKTFVTWGTLGRAVQVCVDLILAQTYEPSVDSVEGPPVVVGILSTADPITYTTFFISYLRLTHSPNLPKFLPFLISPRNSAAAIAYLIEAQDIKYLWVTEGPMHTLATEALSLTQNHTSILTCPSFDRIYSSKVPKMRFIDNENAFIPFSMERPAVILHSSGSTAFPKAITISHQMLSDWSYALTNGGIDFRNDIFAMHSAPLFHVMGLGFMIGAGVAGKLRAVPSPYDPTLPWTPERYLECIKSSESTVVVAVPSFLETWAKDPASVNVLKKLRVLFWGGGPLSASSGQCLVEKGVNIVGIYGATEMGAVTTFVDKPFPEGYEWITLSPDSISILEPQADSKFFELIIMDSQRHRLAVYNTEVNGIPAYATGDLVERHPTTHSLLRIVGRKDDQIILSTGEKTNPGPMERIIMQDPHVKCALMFGRGRFSNGVLIEPACHSELDSLGAEKFKDLIWPAIQAANDYGPAHSRIHKEMVIFSSLSKPFEFTAKNTPRRSLIHTMYEDEINRLYDTVQTTITVPIGQVWDYERIRDFIYKTVCRVTNGRYNVQDNDDFFSQLGCDSLQALIIRKVAIQICNQSERRGHSKDLSHNFVYQYPTIQSLAVFIYNMSTRGEAKTCENDFEDIRTSRLRNLISRYTEGWTPDNSFREDGEVILLTGSTGNLGSELLAQLEQHHFVSHVYAFNRPSNKTGLERHTIAFEDSGNDYSLLHSKKITYVEGDLSKEGFGVQPTLFKEMLSRVTTIIHNAWRVDFNLTLPSFESAICGTRNLIDFALSCSTINPPKFIFISSVGVHKSWTSAPTVAEAPMTDVRLVNSMGYGESKWVAEQVLECAARETRLKPLIIRVGQLSGGKHGKWNPKEWFPTLIRISKKIGGLPDYEDARTLVSFIPVHIAAKAIIELRGIPQSFAHVVHPRPICWREMIKHVSDCLELPVLPYSEWLSLLEKTSINYSSNENGRDPSDSVAQNPAVHLLDMFRCGNPVKSPEDQQPREFMGLPLYDTTNAMAGSSSLRNGCLKQLGKEDVENWLAYWHKKRTL